MVNMAKDPYDLPPEWRAAVDHIIRMMDTGIASSAELPVGPASDFGIERYAREVVANNPQSNLGIMYGLCSVATCVAAQGAYVLLAPIAGGGYLEVPAIQHFIGIAKSGWRKSTALNVVRAPLRRALAEGEKIRRQVLPAERQGAEAQASAEQDLGDNLKKSQFYEVYHGGLCAATLVKDPTVEGLRNMLVQNGGLAAVLAGEADVFRNVSAYSSDSGSLTFFLDCWSQDDVSTMRAGQGMLSMDEAALILGVLFQTDVFAEVTSGAGRGGTGSADSYQQRGVFGRVWVAEAEQTGGWELLAQEYGDDVAWDTHEGPDGMADREGRKTPLGLALAEYSGALRDLVVDSNHYRMFKALRHSWLNGVIKYGQEFQVPEIDQEPRKAIRLGRDALVAYSRVQRMYHVLEAHLEGAGEDAQAMWGPLVSRFVQHVLREALVVSLAGRRREVSAEIITDCALRIIPWRWSLSTRALVKRNAEKIQNVIALSFSENPDQVDLSPEAKVHSVMVAMARRSPHEREQGWSRRDIVRKAVSTINPKSARVGVGPVMAAALETLSKQEESGITKVECGYDAVRQPVYRYTISRATVDNNKRR